ncbi:uncharacterized protein F54H12.2-like [Clytia hemisphaerica]|uniref:uncharacterized protein F54H12.2-like n=1 Tax=Clytia hemisphaerica TaxID=252671 RepID=UPI0034D55F5C
MVPSILPLKITLTKNFLDLSNSYVRAKVQILNGDGTNIGVDDDVTSVNYTIGTLFRQLDVMLNGSIISDSTNTYAYRAYMETLLNYGEEAKKTSLSMGLYTKDEAKKLDELKTANGNRGLDERSAYTENSKIVTICGRPHIDIAHQGKLLVNGLPIKITLHRQKDAFSLLTNDETPTYKFKIVDIVLRIKKIELTPHKFGEIQQTLEKESIAYPINRVTIKTRSIPIGLGSMNWENCIMGQMPNRVIIGMVENNAFNGSYKKNPYNFQHFNVSSIGVYVNGESLPANPMKLNFDQSDFLDGYRSLFDITGKLYRDEGCAIKRSDYPNGYSFFAFDLSPSQCGSHQEVQKTGSLRISFEFSKALEKSVTVILYSEFDNSISINKARNILKDF